MSPVQSAESLAPPLAPSVPLARRAVPLAPGHAPRRRARGRHRLARSRGHLAPRSHRKITFHELWSGERPLRRGVAPSPLPLPREDGWKRPAARTASAAEPRARRRTESAAPARRPPVPDHRGHARCPVAPDPAPARSLPVLEPSANPCATAPCRTADNTMKAACCRDLQIEIMCTRPSDARGPGAFPPVAVSLQDRAGGGLFARRRDDLRLRIPGGRRGGLHPAWAEPGRRPAGQTRPLHRVAPQEPGAPPRMRFRPASQKRRPAERLTRAPSVQ